MKTVFILAAVVSGAVSGVVSGGLSTAAFAADAIEQPPSPPPAATFDAVPTFTWSGPYVGVHGGYGWGDGNASAAGGSASDNFDGGRFGGFAGYNWQLSSGFVAGVEGDVNYDWNKNSYPGGYDINSGFSGSVRGRVGYGFDKALLYAAGGWTGTRVKLGGPISDHDTLNGWTIGAGLDYAFTNNMFGRVEYRYNDYGHGDLGGSKIDFNQNIINVGVGVKF